MGCFTFSLTILKTCYRFPALLLTIGGKHFPAAKRHYITKLGVLLASFTFFNSLSDPPYKLSTTTRIKLEIGFNTFANICCGYIS